MQNKPPRRQVASIGAWNTIQLDYRDPYVVTFWSIAYGGLGHILLDRYFRGLILLSGEIFLNFASHLNMAIYYTISRQFEAAKNVLDTRWFLLYLAVYCFAIIDSYRETIVINNMYRLADRENAAFNGFVMNSYSFNMLDAISPYFVLACAAIMPGAGCFVIRRMNRAVFLMVLWTFISSMSGFYTAVIYTVGGQTELAIQAINIQWFLNLPSLWFFSIYEAYQCASENNKLFRRELVNYLQNDYQSVSFMMPKFNREVS